jgi:hypothetical protein
VIHHPPQQCRGHELLGDARKRRAQPVASHLGSRLLIDPAQSLPGVRDREQGSCRLRMTAGPGSPFRLPPWRSPLDRQP